MKKINVGIGFVTLKKRYPITKKSEKARWRSLHWFVKKGLLLIYPDSVPIKEFLELEYAQFLAAIDFLYPEAEFSTEHGVKGEEYDNVIFVISKGWNQYQFETYAPMIDGSVPIPKGKEASFIRNHNLFYMCCSRPKKRLIFFVSVPMSVAFLDFLNGLVGNENIVTYSEYIS
jgi:DNA helicase-2/ATP-dependent DNA helicase PcrA